MKTATEEAIQLDRMIATAERIANRLQTRWDRADIAINFARSDFAAHDRIGLRRRADDAFRAQQIAKMRRDAAWRRVDRLVDLRDSAAIPTR
jgi:hypothetical protein